MGLGIYKNQSRMFGNWIPDGKERNDYEHKDFVPFKYDEHGKCWDSKKWPLNETGKEQSPIALYRNKKDEPNLRHLEFMDKEYEH